MVKTLAMVALLVTPVIAGGQQKPLGVPGPPTSIPPSAVAAMERDRQSVRTKGYVDRSSTSSPADVLLATIGEKEQAAEARLRTTGQRTLPDELGFLPWSPELARHLPLEPNPLAARLIPIDARAYVLTGPARVTRVISKTELGPAVIREMQNSRFMTAPGTPAPALRAAGVPLYVATVKYRGERWGTSVMAQTPSRVIHVDLGTRIVTDADRRRLIEFMTPLVAQ
jgi:hypothetical protein